jgi:aspartate carbamoyltransferase catalytic subunit
MRSNARVQYATNTKVSRLAKFDVVSIEDLATSDIERIFALADGFAERLERGEQITVAAGLIMATLFYEPSTRTRLSFESSMHRLGGAVISSADMQASSAAKGESLADTVRVVAGYADLIVLRHPHDGAARVAAEYAPCPVLNAGDGSREHPTQTLCDLYILRKKKGHLKGLTVALCGDLKFGRTVHSLIYALARFGANIVAVPTSGMDVPDYVLERLAAERNYSFSTVTMDELKSLAGGLDALYLTPSAPHQMALFTGDAALQKIPMGEPPAALDAFYVTRLQKERMSGKEAGAADYVRFDARALRTSKTVAAHQRAGVRARRRPARSLLRAGSSGSARPDGADRMADGESRRRFYFSACGGPADSLQGRSAATMLESELHHALRGRPPGSAIYARPQQ